jgi:site-specific DNA recombinase
VSRELFDRVQSRFRKFEHHAVPRREGKSPYLLGGLMRCGTCGGPVSVSGQRVKNGVRYATFACTIHRTPGATICPNGASISEKRITNGLLDAIRKLLTGRKVREAFAEAFNARITERSSKTPTADLEKQLAAARKRVTNAKCLLLEDPDDLEIRRTRTEAEAEARRLEDELASVADTTPPEIPSLDVIEASIAPRSSSRTPEPER